MADSTPDSTSSGDNMHDHHTGDLDSSEGSEACALDSTGTCSSESGATNSHENNHRACRLDDGSSAMTDSGAVNSSTSAKYSDKSSDMTELNAAEERLKNLFKTVPETNSECNLSDSVEPDSQTDGTSGVFAKLKKDDSGIDVERSPVKEHMLSDESEANHTDNEASSSRKASDSLLRSPRSTKSNRPSTSNESEGLVADIDSDEATTGTTHFDLLRPTRDSDSDSNDEETVESRQSTRKRRHNRSYSNSSSSAEEKDDAGDTKSETSTRSKEEMEVDIEPPKDKWHAIFELRHREHGYSNNVHMSTLFQRRTSSSVRLAQRLKLQNKLEYHEGCVNALHFNRSGTLLASGSDDLNIVVWKWAENRRYCYFDSKHRSNVFQSKFMPYTGDCHMVSCARDGQVRLADLSSTGSCVDSRRLAQHRGAAHKLALLSDSSHQFYSCGEDAITFNIDLRQPKPNKLCTTKENDVKVALYSIHANPSKTDQYCVGGRDHYIRIYDKRMINEEQNNGVLKRFCPHHLVDSDIKANVTCAVYSYNGSEILGTYNDEDIYLFDSSHSDGADFIHRYKGHRNSATVKGVNFYGPKSEFIVSGSDCGNVFLWEKESEKIVHYFHGDEGGVINVLEPHPIAPFLATSGLDHDVKIWAPTAEEPTKLNGLKKVIKHNRKERDEERVNEPDMLDGQMLWFLMQHLRRSARRRARGEGQDGQDPSSSSSNSDQESDESEDMSEPMQCAPS